MSQRSADLGIIKHAESVSVLNNLVIDLKLRLMGRPPRDEITMARLEEATKALGEIQQCRKQVFRK